MSQNFKKTVKSSKRTLGRSHSDNGCVKMAPVRNYSDNAVLENNAKVLNLPQIEVKNIEMLQSSRVHTMRDEKKKNQILRV